MSPENGSIEFCHDKSRAPTSKRKAEKPLDQVKAKYVRKIAIHWIKTSKPQPIFIENRIKLFRENSDVQINHYLKIKIQLILLQEPSLGPAHTYNTCCSPSMLGGVEKLFTTPSMLGEQIFARRACSATSFLEAMLAEQRADA
uniref:Uncharacterized protein n=1 Tax=Romanomermis culicivorax TaxID=13658 RepID=A0A915K0A8_ROMCU